MYFMSLSKLLDYSKLPWLTDKGTDARTRSAHLFLTAERKTWHKIKCAYKMATAIPNDQNFTAILATVLQNGNGFI